MKRLLRTEIFFLLVVLLIIFSLVVSGCDGSHHHDETSPTVTETVPADGELGVLTTSSISVTFSEPMDQISVEDALSSVPALPVGTFSWDLATNTLTFVPDTDLNEITYYMLTVGVDATDTAGNPLESAYTFGWETALPYKVLNLQSDYTFATGNSGVMPSNDGQYIFWSDGTSSSDNHLYRVKISDLSSQTIWTNRSAWGIYDDGVETWVGNYEPNTAARITYSDPIALTFINIGLGHTIGLDGNALDFPFVYFGNSVGAGVGYWNRSNDTTGIIPGSSGAYVYQSAIIGDKVYIPRGHTSSPGIMVVDAINNPVTLEKTILAGNAGIAYANDICADDTSLYVHNSNSHEILKIDPEGEGSIVATFTPGVTFTNMAVVGDYVYSGVLNTNIITNKNIYIMDKDTGDLEVRDCSAYLPTAVGTPKWDFYNDGIWYGPQSSIATELRWAYFIPRSIIENDCTDITPP